MLIKNVPKNSDIDEFMSFIESYGVKIEQMCPIYTLQLVKKAQSDVDKAVKKLKKYLKEIEFKEVLDDE